MDLSPKPSFRYPSLHANQDTFHLLVLLPLTNSGMNFECRIGLARLDDQIVFEALSYVWGDPIDFPVTENLYSALHRLRHKGNDRPHVLWLDSLCISQQDIPERNDQVKKMCRIKDQRISRFHIRAHIHEPQIARIFRGRRSAPRPRQRPYRLCCGCRGRTFSLTKSRRT